MRITRKPAVPTAPAGSVSVELLMEKLSGYQAPDNGKSTSLPTWQVILSWNLLAKLHCGNFEAV